MLRGLYTASEIAVSGNSGLIRRRDGIKLSFSFAEVGDRQFTVHQSGQKSVANLREVGGFDISFSNLGSSAKIRILKKFLRLTYCNKRLFSHLHAVSQIEHRKP